MVEPVVQEHAGSSVKVCGYIRQKDYHMNKQFMQLDSKTGATDDFIREWLGDLLNERLFKQGVQFYLKGRDISMCKDASQRAGYRSMATVRDAVAKVRNARACGKCGGSGTCHKCGGQAIGCRHCSGSGTCGACSGAGMVN